MTLTTDQQTQPLESAAASEPAAAGDAAAPDVARRTYSRGVRLLTVGIASTGLLTFAYFSIASHVLGKLPAKRIDLLWTLMFVIISVIYRPTEQLLSRTIARRRAHGESAGDLRPAMAIQAGFALAFLIAALLAHEFLVNSVFEGDSYLYVIMLIGTLAYAGSYFARGWLAGHQRFELYGSLLIMESVSRISFVLLAALGITHGQSAVAVGIAVAPFLSMIVVPAAFARRGRSEVDEALDDAPITVDEADAALAGPGTEGVQESAAHTKLTLRRGATFAAAVAAIMFSEQVLLNASVLTVDATAANAALAGIVFNVMLIARAPLLLFQAIQTSLLPHLTGLEETAGHDAFAHAIRVTVVAIAAFAAAVALGLLVLGPFVLEHLFGQKFHYNAVGLALIGVGMGFHLTSGALNQAALARDRARTASFCWGGTAVVFLGWMFTPLVHEELLRAELGYAFAAALLAACLTLLYRAGKSARTLASAA